MPTPVRVLVCVFPLSQGEDVVPRLGFDPASDRRLLAFGFEREGDGVNERLLQLRSAHDSNR
jgi:hypothetical protein